MTILNEEFDLRFVLEEYPDGGTAIHLVTVEPDKPPGLFARLSIWIEATPQLKPGEFFVRPWGANQELLSRLSEAGYIGTVEPSTDQGVPGGGIRLYRLTEKGRQWIVPQSD